MLSKKITIIIIALISLLTIRCDNKLDIKPKQSIDADEALNSPEKIQSALVGTYKILSSANTLGRNSIIISEMLGSNNDLIFVGSWPGISNYLDKKMITSDEYLTGLWVDMYKAINQTNIILNSLDKLEESEKAKVEGETRFLRALTYFELVRLWAKPYEPNSENSQIGVPLITEATTSANSIQAATRESVSNIYTFIEKELLKAKTLLEPFGENSNFASTYSASAVLSRVYLQENKFKEAAEEANRVIQSNLYKLTENPLKAFNNNENCSEDVLAWQQNKTAYESAGLSLMFASLSGTGRGDYEIATSFLEKYEENDIRGGFCDDLEEGNTYKDVDSMFYKGIGTLNNSGGINIVKYGDYYTNVPFIRLSEMYLTRAEANTEEKTQIGASPKNDIDKIRTRAGLEKLDTEPTLEQIRKERQLELAFEGFRLHDLRRWKEQIGDLPYNSTQLILPIPQREIEATGGKLQQNEGY